MRVRHVYCPDLRVGRIALPQEEAHHLSGVLRAQAGEDIVAFDGAGHLADAKIAAIDRRSVVIDVHDIAEHPFELPHRLTLAVAMSKQHRQDFLIEKCTELGVAAIWPIVSERSVARPGDFAIEKWSRRAIEAAKQSHRVWVPGILAAQPLEAALGRAREFDGACLTHIGDSAISFHDALTNLARGGSLLVLVGPEGGWTPHELALAQASGLRTVSLSPTILRTETAAVAVCAAAALHAARCGPPPAADQ